jgi:hypothetical protein
MPLQISLALSRVAHRHELPDLEAVEARLGAMVDAYLADAVTTSEPAGSVAHWALYRTPDGHPMRFADQPRLPYALIKAFDIPNDLDTASQAFLWLQARGEREAFRTAYISLLGAWTDTGRTRQHEQEARWKELDSGAFLTWTEPDRTDLPSSRIPSGVNDVDCVVNLNILTSLYAFERTGASLPEAVWTARDAACSLLNQAVRDAASDRCALYYDETQFYLAYARALTSGVSCLEESREEARAQLAALGRERLGDDADIVDIAETTLALKLLYPTDTRSPVRDLTATLDLRLAAQIEPVGEGMARLPEGMLYRGTIHPLAGTIAVTGYWYSHAASTALGLEALLAE